MGQPITEVSQEEFVETREKPYTVQSGETLWGIAARFKIDAEELLFYNSLPDASAIQPGLEIHLPIIGENKPDERAIWYELQTKQMHIINKGGAYKWSFGNAKKLSQIEKSGPTWAWNAAVEVVATAHVPLEEGVASYYMTATDLGTYIETGRVNYNIGFNHTHLAEGAPVEVPATVVEPIVTPEKTIEDVKFISRMDDPNMYKVSYHKFRETGMYRVVRDVWVKEYDGRQQDHFLSEGEKVELIGTFMRGEMIYGRPWSDTNNFWFGIPMHCLEAINEDPDIDELGELPVADRIAAKKALSPSEKVWDVFSRNVGRGVRLSENMKKQIKRKVIK